MVQAFRLEGSKGIPEGEEGAAKEGPALEAKGERRDAVSAGGKEGDKDGQGSSSIAGRHEPLEDDAGTCSCGVSVEMCRFTSRPGATVKV